MNNKILVLLLVVIAVLMAVTMSQYMRPETATTTTTTQIDTITVTDTVYVRYWRERVITTIDTMIIDGHEFIIARYRDRIDTNRVTVDLDIAYHEYDRTFDVKVDVAAEIDTVYITETHTNNIVTTLPPKGIGFFSGVTALISAEDGKRSVNDIGIDAGMRIKGRYDASFMITAGGTIGVRLGLAF